MSEPNLCNTHICSARHITAFLHLGTLDSSTLALCMKAMLNSQITNKKLKTAEKNKQNVTLARTLKGHLFTVWELKQGRVAAQSHLETCVSCLKITIIIIIIVFAFIFLPVHVCDSCDSCDSWLKVMQVLFLALQINFSQLANLQKQN